MQVNPFVFICTFLYIAAAVWYIKNGQVALGCAFIGYAFANLALLFVK